MTAETWGIYGGKARRNANGKPQEIGHVCAGISPKHRRTFNTSLTFVGPFDP